MTFDLHRLHEIRKRLNLTQHQFAKAADVSQSLIAKIESGRIDPSYSKVQKIEQALNGFLNKTEPEVRTFMTKKLIFIEATSPVEEAVALMKKHNISQVPVLQNNQAIGLVSESSVLEADLSQLGHLKVKDVMAEAPPIVSESTKLSIVASLLKQFPLILVRKKEHFIGVVTKADLLHVAMP
ncbi:MAG TPA: CBS domain-containing protein [Candidatus Nanoarchaeia archaeon]|nr:CBS domain-containing protein [Candidatus Nanoarchaeia archaeon]